MNNLKVEIVQSVENTLYQWGAWNRADGLRLGYPASDVSARALSNGGVPLPPLDDDTAMLINDALSPLKSGYAEAWNVAEAIYIKCMPMSHKQFPVSLSKATRIRPMIVGLVMGKLYPAGMPENIY